MKRILILVASAALLASGLQIAPAAAAEEAPEVPATVQIDDPKGDANGLNDQDNAYGTPAAGEGDHVGPAGGTATDLLKVWFTNDAKNVALNFQTAGDPANLAYDTYFRFSSNAGTGSVANDETRGCLQWVASVNGAAGAWQGDTQGALTDKCNTGEEVVGPLVTAAGPEGTFITTITFPRTASPLLADGGKITAPFGVSRVVYVGPDPDTAAVVTMDNTKRGTDYAIAAGSAGKVGKTPPGKSNPPGKKKGCAKGKGKKRGCEGKGKKSPKPGKPSAACAPFAPGEAGKDKPLVTLTDAATEEKPVEQTVTLDASAADADLIGELGAVIPASHDAFNIQVDPKAAAAGLYALIEFPDRNDYDLNLLHTDGSYAARSRAFNPIIELNNVPIGPIFPNGLSTSGHGGESTAGSEKLVGIKTADCGGWTLDVANYLGQGGEFTVKLWLGEAKIDPQEPGAETP